MLTAASGTGGARRPKPAHPAVTHRGRPAVHQATLTAFRSGPVNPKIPKKYFPKTRPSSAPSLKLPSIGKLGKGGGIMTPVPVSGVPAAPGRAGSPRMTIPHPLPPVSPYVNPFAGTTGVFGQRIDQGVDYGAPAGTRIGALGAGKIIQSSTSSGWPGGGFVSEQLTSGPGKGHQVFFAEDVTPSVRAGQTVKAGQQIGTFASGGAIEAGYAAPGQTQALAYTKGQSNYSGDPGAFSTGFGIAFNKLMTALGAPSGKLQSTISGSAPASYSATGGRVAGSSRVSMPPAIPPSSGVHGVNPPSSVPLGPVQTAANVTRTAAKAKRNLMPPVKSPGPTSGPPTTGGSTGTGTPGTTTTTTTTTVPSTTPISTTGPFPSPYTTLWGTTGTTSSTSTVLLIGGAALLIGFLVMDARKGKKSSRAGLSAAR